MMFNDKVFFGNTPADQRAYMLYMLKKIHKIYDILVIPCVGQFALVKLAIDAGFAKENIYTSDISAFSSLLGYYYSDKELNDLPIEPKREKRNEEEYLAEIFYQMKISQVHVKTYFDERILKQIQSKESDYKEQVKKILPKFKKLYNGIHYEIKDMREIFNAAQKEKFYIINPPAYKNGYERMFAFGEWLKWDVHIEEWDWKKEYHQTFKDMQKNRIDAVFYRYKDVQDFPAKNVVFMKEYKIGDRIDSWIVTDTKLLDRLEIDKMVRVKTEKAVAKKYKILEEDYKITRKSKIGYRIIDKSTALYYRDMFAHKMKASKAENYIMVMIDGKVFGVVGMHTTNIIRGAGRTVYEVFGFNRKLGEYSNVNRLLMMIITTREFNRWLLEKCYPKTIYPEVEEFQTTCLSKYRKLKLNNGLLKIKEREKMENGTYKIVYKTKLYDRSIQKCVIDYLEELDGKSI